MKLTRKVLAENMLRFGPRDLNTFNQNNLLKLIESITEPDLPQEIYWRSCDGNYNKLSDTSRDMLAPHDDKPGLWKFTSQPNDEAETMDPNGEPYTITGCLGVEISDDEYNQFNLTQEDGKHVLYLAF